MAASLRRAALSTVFAAAPQADIPADVVHAGMWASIMAVNEGDYVGADALLEQVLELARASGDANAVLFAENQRGWVAFMRGDTASAREVYERTYAGMSQTTEAIRLACGLQLALAHAQAVLAEQTADFNLADRLFELAIAAERATDDQPSLLRSLALRGAVAAAHGDRHMAAAALSEALQVGELHGSKLHLAHLLEAVANLMLETDVAACVRLAGAGARLRTVMGAPRHRRPKERGSVATWRSRSSAPANARTPSCGSTRKRNRSRSHCSWSSSFC